MDKENSNKASSILSNSSSLFKLNSPHLHIRYINFLYFYTVYKYNVFIFVCQFSFAMTNLTIYTKDEKPQSQIFKSNFEASIVSYKIISTNNKLFFIIFLLYLFLQGKRSIILQADDHSHHLVRLLTNQKPKLFSGIKSYLGYSFYLLIA